MSLFNLVKAQMILVSFTLTNHTMSYRVVHILEEGEFGDLGRVK